MKKMKTNPVKILTPEELRKLVEIVIEENILVLKEQKKDWCF